MVNHSGGKYETQNSQDSAEKEKLDTEWNFLSNKTRIDGLESDEPLQLSSEDDSSSAQLSTTGLKILRLQIVLMFF